MALCLQGLEEKQCLAFWRTPDDEPVVWQVGRARARGKGMMKMTRVLGLMAAMLFWWTLSGAEAACSGSGQSWNCTAGTSPAEINSTLSSASDGATLTFAAGNYTWGGGTVIRPSLSKGVTLACASIGACHVSYSGGNTWSPAPTGGTSTKLYRVTGFDFTSVAAGTTWWLHDDSPETTFRIRLDHNRWTLDDNDMIMNVSTRSVVYIYGVIDHNTITGVFTGTIPFMYTATQDTTSPVTRRMGTDLNLFFEDNVLTSITGGLAGCLDAFGTPTGWVWRYNTITNCRLTTHGVAHSYGPSNVEYYGNALIYNASASLPDGYRSVHHQGSGTIGVWGNTILTASPLSGNAFAFLHYFAFQPNGAPACSGTSPNDGNRSPVATYRGYPCYHQPGRDLDGVLFPVFNFMNVNVANGGKVDLIVNGGGGPTPDYTNNHLVPNRDFYNAVSATAQTSQTSPFNGTTGIGFGTLANRPTTCTTTVEAADAGRGGVMYWATDQGSWNQSSSNPYGVQQNGADGVLYMCTAPNTWSVYYTPYTYPHPLQSGQAPPAGGGSGSGAVPQAPANLHLLPSQQ